MSVYRATRLTFRRSQHYRRQQSPESAVSRCSSSCILSSLIRGSAAPPSRLCIPSAWGSSFPLLGSPFPHLCSAFLLPWFSIPSSLFCVPSSLVLHSLIFVLRSLFLSCPFPLPWFSIPSSLFCVPSSLVLHSLFVLRSLFLSCPFPLPWFSIPSLFFVPFSWVLRVVAPQCSPVQRWGPASRHALRDPGCSGR